jgi:hypothetical protein
MSKYTFTCEYTDLSGQPDGSKITVEVQEVTLMNTIEAFERFLKGVGFVFDGHLAIVDEEEYPEEIYQEDDEEETTTDNTYSSTWPFPKSVELYDSQDVMPMPGTLGSAEVILPNKCTRCGLTKEQLGTNTCYDENCGFKL